VKKFLVVMLAVSAVCLGGCAWADKLFGKTEKEIVTEVDANKDGKLSKEEWKASPYDLNHDGEIQADELEKAMAEHPGVATGEGLLGLVSAFFPPAAVALKLWLDNKKNLKALVAGGERVLKVAESKGALDRETIKTLMREGQEAAEPAKNLYQQIAKVKTALREDAAGA
jgi:hypothetical protein